ncbi:Cyclopropane-fatty-acyl-phospholipid synthase [Kribbella flavida DSM 17836]|uniref:Cyclopropane-fatty-acyl-phospholipid synthase n=1 Tax=Kribbella flavida (strain DSM 17836 / JCM 10339 / NBRC 14399) TaxID=479435 RepID=D2PXU7_KRIFD|nr:cyclopropane-fatty-acyl-phospholipid synthase family protein [Kribbella flavida]ADB31739.1 Cyclopropane-fatty-acyl-phospholipid synthase [Kribbella flavida DSM 17836]
MTDLLPAVHQPVPQTWPSLVAPRSNPVRRAGALAAIRMVAKDLPVSIVLDNRRYGNGGPTMLVHRSGPFLDRLGQDAGSGFGEAYLAGDWDPEPGTDLADLLVPFAERFSNEETRHLLPRWAQSLRWLVTKSQPADQENDRAGARENVSRHYDLSNAMFSEFLDPTLTYSAAYFGGDPLADLGSASYDELTPAQLRKLDAILDAAGVRSGSRVLDIGCGWASLAIRAAQRGAWVTAITIASQQALLAQRRIADAGVSDRVQVALRDYRDQIGEFDAVLSVEMIEAVGEKYWPVYFDAIERRLAPDGVAVVQAIVMPHERMLATRNTFTWVQKYIFPGGLIPSVKVIKQVTNQHTGLHTQVLRSLGPDYARTLRIWRNRFIEQWPNIATLGFDDTFCRMWEFYLAYSEAGFRAGYLDDVQLLLTRR